MRLSSILAISALAITSNAAAQFKNPLKGIKVPKINALNLSPDALFGKGEAVSTSFDDVVGAMPELDNVTLSRSESLFWRSSGQSTWQLSPGNYSGDVQTYCLHAGTSGPSRGEGYLFAPLKGHKVGIISKLLRNSPAHPDVNQRNIQSLIWSIEAHTKFDDLNNTLKETASQLLEPKDIMELRDGVLGLIPKDQLNGLTSGMDSALRPIMEAQNSIRGLVTQANAPFDQLEKVAVLNGTQIFPNDNMVPRGRWCYRPEGYFIRYMPHGYSTTNSEVYIPDATETKRDRLGRVTGLLNGQLSVGFDYGTSQGAVSKPVAAAIRSGKLVRRVALTGSNFIHVGQPLESSADPDVKSLATLFASVPLATSNQAELSVIRDVISSALLNAVAKAQGAKVGTSFALDPVGQVATPADRGRQRLGLSPRVNEPGGPYIVTIYVNRGGGSWTDGHAWVALSDSKSTRTVGLHPEDNWGVIGLGTPYVSEKDALLPWEVRSKHWEVTREGYAAAMNYTFTKQSYNAFHVCADFAKETARIAGVPESELPEPAAINTPNDFASFFLSHGGASK